MPPMHITALCLTYGRVSALNDAIQMFLNQTHKGPKELLVFSTFQRQRLCWDGDIPEGVTVINFPVRPENLGRCRNCAISKAKDGIICTWDDDDQYLPNHLENFVKHFEDGIDWVWHSRQFYSEGFVPRQIVRGTFNSLAFTKNAWQRVGGYAEMNAGEDRQFVGKLMDSQKGKKVDLDEKDISFIYSWDNAQYHLSGEGDDKTGKPTGHERIAKWTHEQADRGLIPTGDVVLKPALRHDYPKLVAEFFAERDKHRGRADSVCIVQLGRLGDIINCLPIALLINNQYAKPHIMVSREFATLLEGVSYCTPYPVDIPFDHVQPALALAKKEFTHVIQTQIYGKDFQCDRQTLAYNIESWRQAGFLNKFHDYTLRPVFDRRNAERERLLLTKLRGSGKPFLLVQVTGGFSSPFPKGQELLAEIRKQCSEKYEVLDIAQMRFERIYDLLALMETPGAAVISVDTSPLHLMVAVNPCPKNVAILNPAAWLGSALRCARSTLFSYQDAAENIPSVPACLLSDDRHSESLPCLLPKPAPPRRILHCVERHPDTADNQNRKVRARKNWDILYKEHGVVPCHMSEYVRSARHIGDARNLPYLKDVLAKAVCDANDDDIILFTNDDVWLNPKLADYLLFHVGLYEACASFRCEFDVSPNVDPKTGLYLPGPPSVGQDLFAFTRRWLDQHWGEIPDFILGASEWDWCLACIIRKDKLIPTTRQNIGQVIHPAEIPTGYVAHQRHRPAWIHPDNVNAAPSQIHNRRLFKEWLDTNLPEFAMSTYPGRPARRRVNGKETISVRRTASLGDVLAATCVSTALSDMGFKVEFQSALGMHCLLRRHPRIEEITLPNVTPDVDLDGAYERHPERRKRHFAEMFTERANVDLAKFGIALPTPVNFAPRINSDPGIVSEVMPMLENHPHPWVMICPNSWSWINRTVPDPIWQDAAKTIHGTKFWLGRNVAPSGIVDLQCRHVDRLIEFIGLADLLITVDSGPLHIAAAIGTPTVAIHQASSPELHISDQRDFIVIGPNLPCLNCQDDICRIEPKLPPCQQVPPHLIAHAANARLQSVTTENICAVIVVYKPKVERLNRCLEHVLPQVQEVIVAGDWDTEWPIRGARQDGKIKYIQKPSRNFGYGRLANYAARHSNAKYLWFLNDDVFPESNVAERLLAVIRTDALTGAVTHTLRYPNGTINYAGKFRTPGHVGFGHIDHRAANGRYKEPVEQESLCGCSMLVPRKVFYDAGSYDEEFFLYSEDDSFAMQVRKSGYKIMFEPRASAIHEEHGSTSLISDLKPVLHRSNALFEKKWRWYFERNPDVTKLGVFT